MSSTVCELDLANDLSVGLERGEFYIVLQPKICVKTQQTIGVEVLSRWRHPRFGRISPDVWVVMAESLGLMRDLTHWLVEKSLSCMHLRNQGNQDFHFAINVCPSVFDEALVEHIARRCQEEGVSPQAFELEITESVKAKSLDKLASAVRYAQALGFRVALDDFGAGYSSMQYLVELPVNTVKIDQSLVRKAGQTRQGLLVCKTLIGLAKEMNATVVCEGVETAEQLNLVRQMGADVVQGFLFGEPMPIDMVGIVLNESGMSHPRSYHEWN